jgi:acetyltransferase-like isoleucine patch superfamily enzyme
MIKFLSKIFCKKKKAEPQYKIGRKKFHNSLVDSLVPEFVEIGENFTSGPGSIILAHDASLFFHNGCYRVEKTVIGNNVFLGANAIILPGVKIGDGVIIGAGSVVTKNIESNTVVAGNPAKVICTVDDYIVKCTYRNVLIEAPESFKKLCENQRLTESDIMEFRYICIDRLQNK